MSTFMLKDYSLFSEILYSLKVYSPAKFVLGETDNKSDPLYIWWPFWYLKNSFMIQPSYPLRQNTPNFWFLFMWHYFHIPASCLSCSGDKLGCHHLYEVCSQKWTQPLDNQSWGAQGALGLSCFSPALTEPLVLVNSCLCPDSHSSVAASTDKYSRWHSS